MNLAQRAAPLALLITGLLLALPGCDRSPAPAPLPAEKPLQSPAPPEQKVPSPPPAVRKEVALPESARRLGPFTDEEWNSAREVNTQGQSSRPSHCEMREKDGWVRVLCTGKMVGHELMSGFGEKDHDYFLSLVPEEKLTLVLKLEPGTKKVIRLCSETERASLLVDWQKSDARPRHIALALGPACDGSEWGATKGRSRATCGPQICKEAEVCCGIPGESPDEDTYSCLSPSACQEKERAVAWTCSRASDCPKGGACCGTTHGVCIEDAADCDPGQAATFCDKEGDCDAQNERLQPLGLGTACQPSPFGPEGTKSCQPLENKPKPAPKPAPLERDSWSR